MKCLACDIPLTDLEATTKYRNDHTRYLDLCTRCLELSEVPIDALVFNPNFLIKDDDVGEASANSDEVEV
jgi:hypothetical protein